MPGHKQQAHTTIAPLMDSHLLQVQVDDSVEKVERNFRIHKAAYAIALDEQQEYYGLITPSRLFELKMNCRQPESMSARDVCLNRVIAAPGTTSIKAAAELLMRKKAEYLVIMETRAGAEQHAGAEVVAGIVSWHQVLQELLKALDPELGTAEVKGMFPEVPNLLSAHNES